MDSIRLENVSLNVEGASLLSEISMTLHRNELIALVGPNGAGKTTLLRCALGILSPTSGVAMIAGDNATDMSPVERARKLAYLPQLRPLSWPIRVKDIIALGRYAYGAPISNLKGEDAIAVKQAISDCELEHLSERNADTLSGGELARVHCARAFATQAPFLIADEPIVSLDPKHQLSILKLIRSFVDNGGGAMIVLHDISLAARFCDRVIWMKNGRIAADGSPIETVTSEKMADIFDVNASVTSTEGYPALTLESVVPHNRHA
jgi:iron complex transport system ATP-binding protein